ncbi:Tn3 family transposase [Streptomyces sp. LN785]|uniref:Tn3 family transposase n=1 Tax=Streptomyces sp. LN785 TaxID=3112983 RepID=UPI003717DCE1
MAGNLRAEENTARHIAEVSGYELSRAANRQCSIAKINEAITDVVNALARLDMSAAWGDGTTARPDLPESVPVQSKGWARSHLLVVVC